MDSTTADGAPFSTIFGLLQEQSVITLNKLYGSQNLGGASSDNAANDQSPFVCKAVFQSVSALAKNYIMRLLFVDKKLSPQDLADWIAGDGNNRGEHAFAINEMIKLRVLQESTMDDDINMAEDNNNIVDLVDDNQQQNQNAIVKGGGAVYEVNPHFRNSLTNAITAPLEPWSQQLSEMKTTIEESSFYQPSKKELTDLSFVKWEGLLRFLVSVEGGVTIIPGGTIDNFVRRMGLMADSRSNSAQQSSAKKPKSMKHLSITQKGYTYMLKSYQQQVWIFVYYLIQSSSNTEELLSLLFMMSYCQFGEGYPMQALTENQRHLVSEFSQLGLLFLESDRVSVPLFYPANIAINMIFKSYDPSSQDIASIVKVGNEGLNSNGDGDDTKIKSYDGNNTNDGRNEVISSLSSGLRIIVETNMQVVAYLTSELHLALLKLFVEFSVQLPNVAIGKITREKAKEAFRIGIRVHQIIDFLCVHSHELISSSKPIIPTNVVDQLVLWESERYRIKHKNATLMCFDGREGFDPDFFEKVSQYAKRVGANMWSDSKTMTLVVSPDGLDQVQSFIDDNL